MYDLQDKFNDTYVRTMIVSVLFNIWNITLKFEKASWSGLNRSTYVRTYVCVELVELYVELYIDQFEALNWKHWHISHVFPESKQEEDVYSVYMYVRK